MNEQKTLQEASVLEIKAALFDLGVQMETLNQQRQALVNELLERAKTEPKEEVKTDTPTEEVKAD